MKRCLLYFLAIHMMSQFVILVAHETPTSIGYATYFGANGDHDEVNGVHIAEDGTIVVAANIGTLIPPGITPIDLPGVSSTDRSDSTARRL